MHGEGIAVIRGAVSRGLHSGKLSSYASLRRLLSFIDSYTHAHFYPLPSQYCTKSTSLDFNFQRRKHPHLKHSVNILYHEPSTMPHPIHRPTQKSSRAIRQRLGTLVESINIFLKVTESKGRHLFPNTTHISRLIVALFLVSLILHITNGVIYTFVAKSARHIPAEKEASNVSGLQDLKSALSVDDYPSVLVADSEPFKAKGASTDQRDTQSSLVSAPSDKEITHTSNFDSDEEPVARIIVITMDREDSLNRLLSSLVKANYGEDHVDLDIWIDRAKDKPVDEGVLHVCQTADWKQGTKTVHKRATNAGLYEQWIYTWNITEETTEFAVILEDDLEVSPAFYQWLRVARAAYAQDTDVGAFTLQRSTLRPRQIKGVASGSLSISNEHPVFKYKLLGTWGFAPQRDQWVEFRKWFEEKRAKGEKPYVDGLVTTEWYKRQEVNGFAPTMWSQWWIKFVDEKGYFTVTAHLPDGTTLASNWREPGMHYSRGSPKVDFPIFQGNDEHFVMPDNPILVDWDGRTISGNASTAA